MKENTTKRYTSADQRGSFEAYDETIINGKLTIASGASVSGMPHPQATNQAASTASDVATLKTDFNALLTKLKAAGLMAADS